MVDDSSTQDRLRSFAETFPGEAGRRIMYKAADRIDELETHIKLINRIGGLGTEADIDLRLKVVEVEIRQLKQLLGGFATRLDIEMLMIEMKNKGSL